MFRNILLLCFVTITSLLGIYYSQNYPVTFEGPSEDIPTIREQEDTEVNRIPPEVLDFIPDDLSFPGDESNAQEDLEDKIDLDLPEIDYGSEVSKEVITDIKMFIKEIDDYKTENLDTLSESDIESLSDFKKNLEESRFINQSIMYDASEKKRITERVERLRTDFEAFKNSLIIENKEVENKSVKPVIKHDVLEEAKDEVSEEGKLEKSNIEGMFSFEENALNLKSDILSKPIEVASSASRNPIHKKIMKLPIIQSDDKPYIQFDVDPIKTNDSYIIDTNDLKIFIKPEYAVFFEPYTNDVILGLKTQDGIILPSIENSWKFKGIKSKVFSSEIDSYKLTFQRGWCGQVASLVLDEKQYFWSVINTDPPIEEIKVIDDLLDEHTEITDEQIEKLNISNLEVEIICYDSKINGDLPFYSPYILYALSGATLK